MRIFAAVWRGIYASIYVFGHDYLSIARPKSIVTKSWKHGDGVFAVSFINTMWAWAAAFVVNDWLYPREAFGRWALVGLWLTVWALTRWVIVKKGWGSRVEQQQRHLSPTKRTLRGVAAIAFVALSVAALAVTVSVGRTQHCHNDPHPACSR